MTHKKYTPGPWKAEFDETYSVRAGNGYCTRIAIATNLKGRHGTGGRIDPEEVAANARLMAAAPGLLEALEEILPIADGFSFTVEKVAKAKQAIARAYGFDR